EPEIGSEFSQASHILEACSRGPEGDRGGGGAMSGKCFAESRVRLAGLVDRPPVVAVGRPYFSDDTGHPRDSSRGGGRRTAHKGVLKQESIHGPNGRNAARHMATPRDVAFG